MLIEVDVSFVYATRGTRVGIACDTHSRQDEDRVACVGESIWCGSGPGEPSDGEFDKNETKPSVPESHIVLGALWYGPHSRRFGLLDRALERYARSVFSRGNDKLD